MVPLIKEVVFGIAKRLELHSAELFFFTRENRGIHLPSANKVPKPTKSKSHLENDPL